MKLLSINVSINRLETGKKNNHGHKAKDHQTHKINFSKCKTMLFSAKQCATEYVSNAHSREVTTSTAGGLNMVEMCPQFSVSLSAPVVRFKHPWIACLCCSRYLAVTCFDYFMMHSIEHRRRRK